MGLFAGTPLERPVTCEACGQPLSQCRCPRDASGKVLAPDKQTAIVRHEKRGKGKVVTTVSGLDPVASDLAAILKKLKADCGAGGTMHQNIIEVQGDHRDRVAGRLGAMGYRVNVS